jgi:hypothetical protein
LPRSLQVTCSVGRLSDLPNSVSYFSNPDVILVELTSKNVIQRLYLDGCLKNAKLIAHTPLSPLAKVRKRRYGRWNLGALRACNNDQYRSPIVSLTNSLRISVEFSLYIRYCLGITASHNYLQNHGVRLK